MKPPIPVGRGYSGGLVMRPAGGGVARGIGVPSGLLGYPVADEDVRGRLRAIGQRPDRAVFSADADALAVDQVRVYTAATLDLPAHAEMGGPVVGEAHRGRGASGASLCGAGSGPSCHPKLLVVRTRINGTSNGACVG